MKNRFTLVGLFVLSMSLSACGSADDENTEASDTGTTVADNVGERADLPADFPADLIPPQYTSSFYTDMTHINGTEGASFESSEPVQGSIQHYLTLLGEPTIDIDTGDGERSVQWHTTPWSGWIVGVTGNDTETIVGVSKVSE